MAEYGRHAGRDILESLELRTRELERRLSAIEGRRLLTLDRGTTTSVPAAVEGQIMVEETDEAPKYYSNGEWRPFCLSQYAVLGARTDTIGGSDPSQTIYNNSSDFVDWYRFATNAEDVFSWTTASRDTLTVSKSGPCLCVATTTFPELTGGGAGDPFYYYKYGHLEWETYTGFGGTYPHMGVSPGEDRNARQEKMLTVEVANMIATGGTIKVRAYQGNTYSQDLDLGECALWVFRLAPVGWNVSMGWP